MGEINLARIMVADDNYDFCTSVQEYIEVEEDLEFLGFVCSGDQVISEVKSKRPDVLLLDLVMPNRDGMEILEEMRNSKEERPKIIVMSAFGQDSFVSQANSLGVDYYLVKPFSLATLVKRIRQILAISSRTEFHKEQHRHYIQDRVVNYFSLIGVPPHYKGYRYLIDAISLVSEDSNWLNGITKRLYPSIGRRYNTSYMQVERAIRHAIEITWEKGDLDQLQRLFPYIVDAEKGKPTNSSFIATMVDIIKLDVAVE